MSQTADIIRILTTHRLPLADEKLLQAAIGDIFEAEALDFEREVRLGAHDIIDFVVNDTIGIEVKIKGNPRNVFRQLQRYCGYEAIGSIILATNRPMSLPIDIGGKPASIAALGRGWL